MKKTDAVFVGIALLMVLFLNTYFNLTSDVALNQKGTTLEDKFYLAGPDPYYNMRLVEVTAETGKYPYLGGESGGLDPLLNYPLGGTGGRPPLMNMMTVVMGKAFSPFLGNEDALGYAMQFSSALFGALLVIPVYFIGRMLFNRQVGIIAAWLVVLTPVHLSSGHGSAFSLFDTDSLNLLITACAVMFFIMSLREQNTRKSTCYAALSGVMIAAMTLTWVSSQYIYALIAIYAVIQMVIDIFTKKIKVATLRTALVALFTGYLLSFPLLWVRSGFNPTVHLIVPLALAAFGVVYLALGRKKVPWVVSIPVLSAIAGAALVFLYMIRNTTSTILSPFTSISDLIFGSGIYGRKVSLTIAEASTFDISRTAMSFGPTVFIIALFGFVLLIYQYYKKGLQKDTLMMIVWFGVEMWLLSVAGRFLNNLVPLMAIFAAFALWWFILKIDFSAIVKTLRGIGGGWYGLKKAVKLKHAVGACALAIFLVIPNGWMAFDAATPSSLIGEYSETQQNKLGTFGLGVYTERYWQDAFAWLRTQHNGTADQDKPAFLSWWDYGFYCVAMGQNPTVADNFQEGIPAPANFHTSVSELESITVLITRLVQSDTAAHDGKVSEEVRTVFHRFLNDTNTGNLVVIMENVKNYKNTSYNTIIGEEYGGEKYRVREENAIFHDATTLLLTTLDEEGIVMLYKELQDATGKSIRYYGVEGYDVNIFNVFSFLADKSAYGYETAEDDFFNLTYVSDKTGTKFTVDELKTLTEDMSQEDIYDTYGNLTTNVERKDAFYSTMVYRSYVGGAPKDLFVNLSQSGLIPFWTDNEEYPLGGGNYYWFPTGYLSHYVTVYLSPFDMNQSLPFIPRGGGSDCAGMPAVVIAKYYEGARINGTFYSEGQPMEDVMVVVCDTFTQKLQARYGSYTLNRTIEKTPHDINFTTANGSFSVIAPAGAITLQFYSGNVLIKEVTFNGTGVLAPITEAEATRDVEWYRNLGKISVEKGTIKGIVYYDKDGDGVYNQSNDTRLSAKVTVGSTEVQTDANGNYQVQNLIPSSYQVTAIKTGYDATRATAPVWPHVTTWVNVSMTPSKVTVSGQVWIDENNNGNLDVNETVSGAALKANVVSKIDSTQNAVNTSKSSTTGGNYSFSLYPATYKLSVTYKENVNNQTISYTYEETLDIKIGDAAKTKNIKLVRE